MGLHVVQLLALLELTPAQVASTYGTLLPKNFPSRGYAQAQLSCCAYCNRNKPLVNGISVLSGWAPEGEGNEQVWSSDTYHQANRIVACWINPLQEWRWNLLSDGRL